MDFLKVLVYDLNDQGYFATVLSPVLGEGDSIAVMPMPSNEYTRYYDGSYDQGYAFQVFTKHESQMEAYSTLQVITTYLSSLQEGDLPSESGTYRMEKVTITTDPNMITHDDHRFIFGAQFVAKLHVKPQP